MVHYETWKENVTEATYTLPERRNVNKDILEVNSLFCSSCTSLGALPSDVLTVPTEAISRAHNCSISQRCGE